MSIRELKQSANATLQTLPSVKRLALLHVVVLLLSSLLMPLSYELSASAMDGMTGIAALNQRAILKTVTPVVQLLLYILTPFWSFGFLQVALQASRGERPTAGSLLAGFRHWWPLLRFMLSIAITCLAFIMASSWVSSFTYMMTPWGMLLQEELMPLMEEAQTDPAAMEALAFTIIERIWPVYLIAFLGSILLIVLYLYRIRLAPYLIFEGERRPRYATAKSRQATRGHRLWWFKLDLSFWWYYGLQALAVGVSYCYLLFGNSDLAYWIFYGLSLLVQLLVTWQFAGKVETTYALAYQALKPRPTEEATAQ